MEAGFLFRQFFRFQVASWVVGHTIESILLVGSDPRHAFSYEGEKILFLFERDLRTRDVDDSTLAGFESISLDMPSGAHLDLIIPVRMTLGAFSSEVIPLLSDCRFELIALLVVFLHWNRQAPDR